MAGISTPALGTTSGGGGGGNSTIISPIGQETMSASVSVALASDQSNVPMNLTQVGGTNTVTAGVSGLLAVGGNVASGVSDAGNPIKIAGVFNTVLPTITNGQRADAQSDAKGIVYMNNAYKLDSTNDSVSALLTTQTNTTMVGGVNIKEINAVTPLMGNGITGTGSLRVTIASDNTSNTNPWLVQGNKTNNNAAPGATNIGALVAIANASAPTWTEGDEVLLSSDLAGNTRVILKAETTKVIGTVNQGTSPWIGNATLQTQTDTVMIGGINIKEINAVTPLMGNGTTGTGSLRVTIASDNTAYSIKAQDGSGNALVSGSSAVVTSVTGYLNGIGYIQNGASPTVAANSLVPMQCDNKGNLLVNINNLGLGTLGNSDGNSASIFSALVFNYNMLFNGTTWDRHKSIKTALNSTGTGIAAVGLVAQFNDTTPLSITEAQFGNVRMSTNRNLYQTIRDAAGNERGANVTSANELNVIDTATSATGSAVPSKASYIGLLGKTALPTAGSDGNTTGAMSDKFGRLVVLPHGMRDLVLPMTQLTLTGTTTETSLIAAVASVFNDILSITIVNTSATATQVDFRDSTAGTVRWTAFVPPTDMRGIVFNAPLPQAAVNTAWTAKCGTSVSSIIITGTYITNK